MDERRARDDALIQAIPMPATRVLKYTNGEGIILEANHNSNAREVKGLSRTSAAALQTATSSICRMIVCDRPSTAFSQRLVLVLQLS